MKSNVVVHYVLHVVVFAIISYVVMGFIGYCSFIGEVMTHTEFLTKAINLIRHHGQVVIYFKREDGAMRRRKLTSKGKCFVSHMTFSECWGKYAVSCFMLQQGRLSVPQMIREMNIHDRSEGITPLMMEWRIGRNKKRIDYEQARRI